jgi:hypothetical protein
VPVARFHSVADMPPPPPRAPGDPDNLRAALELSNLCRGLRPWHFPPGVHRHRSIDELAAARAAWDAAARGPQTGR